MSIDVADALAWQARPPATRDPRQATTSADTTSRSRKSLQVHDVLERIGSSAGAISSFDASAARVSLKSRHCRDVALLGSS